MKKTAFGLALLIAGLLQAATLQEVAADPKLWPVEVLVTGTAKGTEIRNGRPAGMMLVGGGKKLTVTGVATDGVTGKLGGVTVKVPVDKTDLIKRLDPNYVPEEPVVETAPANPPPVPAAAAPAAGPSRRSVNAPGAMHRRLAGKLVQLEGGDFQEVAETRLAGVKYFGLYYSASWCGPCRQFTPGFISTYRQIKQKYPQFEVVFISSDRSASAMRSYMKDDNMPWTALKYDLRKDNPELMRYAGSGIPCLVLVDASGRVLADSFEGDNYLGPGHVLRETIRILQSGG